MFRITEDPSSGSLVQCLAKHHSNGSIVSVGIDKVGVMAAYSGPLCVCVFHCIGRHTHTHTTVTICCHNTDLVHTNGHDRTITVIFSQALYNAP